LETREDLEKRFEELVKKREELQKDLEWRIPDVENEVSKLRALEKAAKRGEPVDVGVQQTIVDVLSGVLEDKKAELKRVEAEILRVGKLLKKE
jgi:RNA polymerase-binding transcription factor DksA